MEQLAQLGALLAQLMAIVGTEPTPGPQPTQSGHMPTELSDDGRILTEYGAVPMRVSDAIRGNWPFDLWSDAARVSYLESDHWSPTAERNTLAQGGGRCNVPIGFIRGVRIVSEDSCGLFQINVCAHGGTRDYWFDPVNNARKGYDIYKSEGWGAWRFSATTLGLL